jgi:uncharacterized protein (TIGR02302 family)
MDRTDAPEIPGRIKTTLRLTLAGLWAERLVRAFWPLWSLAISAIAALAFGVQDHLPLDAFWTAAVAMVLGLIAAAVWGGRRFRRPLRAEALARVDARLPGQPLAGLRDVQALGLEDPASQALWAAHRARMAVRAADARAVAPDLRLADRDPYALRYMALTALIMALAFGSVWRLGSVSAMTPGGGAQAAAGPAWEGWVQPPAYTGKPTLYLNDQTGDELTLPTGSRVQLRFYGEPGGLILNETVSARTESPPASEQKHDFTILQSGLLEIGGRGGRSWEVTVTPDTPPEIAPEGTMSRKGDGRFRQSFTARDDYGVVRGQVTIALDLAAVDRRYGLAADPEAIADVVLDLPMPMRGKRTEFTQDLVDDLSKSVLSNQPVILTFSASDAAGQAGTAPPVRTVLPGRRFFDPLAAALIEVRRDLLWSRANAARSVQILRAVTWKPEGFIRNERAFLRLRVALRRLEANAQDLTPEVRDELTEELWQIALLVEEGDLTSARERLQRAQDRLDEAIRNGASPEEIQDLMDEMRQALNDYLRMQSEEARKRGDEQTSENGGPSITMNQDQLQQMLDKLQQLMEEGKTAEAAELMEQLRQFMENMQVVQGDGTGTGQGSPGQQAMRDLGQTLRGQQGLSDDAFRDLQDGQEGNDPQQGQPRPGQQDQPPGSDPGRSLAERQGDLRREIERLQREGRLPGAGTGQGEEGRRKLDDAGRAMEDAERALRDGNLPEALDRQAEAMEALRDGMRDFGEALAQEDRREGERQSSAEQQGDLQPGEGRDPLGRQTGEAMRMGSDNNLLQGEEVYRRAEELLEEIRRRSGDLSRPEGERDYLKRLLELF